MPRKYDVFICHASEEKPFVRRLALALKRLRLNVWFDEWCLGVGQSLAWTINDGLRQSRFGIVVLSHAFFRKRWPRNELAGLLTKETRQAGAILPIWYRIGLTHVRRRFPLLADRIAAKTHGPLRPVIGPIARVLKPDRVSARSANHRKVQSVTWDGLADLTKRLSRRFRYANLQQTIDPFWQTRLIADLDTASFKSIADIERAVLRARPAVEAYAAEDPRFFRTGTSYLTKSLGFVDLCFRSRHNWAPETRRAFERYAPLVDWNLGVKGASNHGDRLIAAVRSAHVPRWVLALRTRLRMSPSEFARLFAVRPAVISAWEMGHTLPRGKHLSRLNDIRRKLAGKGAWAQDQKFPR